MTKPAPLMNLLISLLTFDDRIFYHFVTRKCLLSSVSSSVVLLFFLVDGRIISAHRPAPSTPSPSSPLLRFVQRAAFLGFIHSINASRFSHGEHL